MPVYELWMRCGDQLDDENDGDHVLWIAANQEPKLSPRSEWFNCHKIDVEPDDPSVDIDLRVKL